jgi:hypothetical protein
MNVRDSNPRTETFYQGIELMEPNFVVPRGLNGRFAIVKLWPGIKTAEDECIARLKIAAKAVGLDCFEVHADGRLISDVSVEISKSDVDFVLHLHYDTPKLYDAFSLVALWNPVQFYHEWGYSRTSRNLLTHDDFVSCSSIAADDHVNRLIRRTSTHCEPHFKLYHSIGRVAHQPSLGEGKVFYAGINWDALKGGVSRHQDLLKRLDKTGDLRIFGPTIFQGVKVWEGYASYVREIPFDGVSMLDEISRCGIALVLSSQAHKDSELMSNRLFESVAAGALVICDENPFAKRFFGDSLLYIDSRCEIETVFQKIRQHLEWARENPGDALKMITKAQEIFHEKFSLERNLIDIYLGLESRKEALLSKQLSAGVNLGSVGMFLLMPQFATEVLNVHIASVFNQDYRNFSAFLVVDKYEAKAKRQEIAQAIHKATIPVSVIELDFSILIADSSKREMRKMGAVLHELLQDANQLDAIMFVAPNEKLLSNHLGVLARSLARNPEVACAASAAVIKHSNQSIHGVHERLDFVQFNPAAPIGFGRFLFRKAMLPSDLKIVLPYLDRKPMAALIGSNNVTQELPATVFIDVLFHFGLEKWDEGQENNLIASYSPGAFSIRTGGEIVMPRLMSESELAIVSAPPISRFSKQWVSLQVNALKRDGIVSRLNAMGKKFTRKVIV